MKRNPVLLLLSSATMIIAGCSSANDSVDAAAPVGEPNESNSLEIPVRSPQDPILGKVTPNGKCDESVVGIDHSRPTAHITYKGQPGDKIKIEIRPESSSEEPTVQSFEMSSVQTEMQLPTNIQNSTISDIRISAEGRVGTPGECTIAVE